MVYGNYKGESALIPVLLKENVSASFATLISLVRPKTSYAGFHLSQGRAKDDKKAIVREDLFQ